MSGLEIVGDGEVVGTGIPQEGKRRTTGPSYKHPHVAECLRAIEGRLSAAAYGSLEL